MLRKAAISFDKALGFPFISIVEKRRMAKRHETFEEGRKQRNATYSNLEGQFKPDSRVIQELEQNGCAVIRNAVPVELIDKLRTELETHLDSATSLSPTSKDSARQPGDRTGAQVFMTPDELKKGQEYLRQHANYVSIADALVTCPSVNTFAFHDLPVDIARGYLGAVPYLAGFNLRKSYRNELPEFDTLYFHVDPDAPKFLKFFFYLNDVGPEDGPFCVVKGTRLNRKPGWMTQYRWDYDEMASRYGKENILLMTAKPGDVVIADPNAYHRGTKITRNDRRMLTLDYCVFKDANIPKQKFRILQSVYDQLTEKQKAVADHLDVVTNTAPLASAAGSY